VAKIPDSAVVKSITPNNIKKTKLEKSYFLSEGFVLPIAEAEVEIVDHKLKDFKWSMQGGEVKYPMDLDCLVRKIVKTPEYRALFKNVLNIKSVTGMSAMLSAMSFDSSIGFNDNWEEMGTMVDLEGEETEGAKSDNNSEAPFNMTTSYETKFLWTKRVLRRFFSGFYLSDDFEDPETEFFDMKELLKMIGGMWTSGFKKAFAMISFWFRSRFIQNPYNADGEECASEFEKLF
jgi:hypothetical protein